jgi:hypothetical protein
MSAITMRRLPAILHALAYLLFDRSREEEKAAAGRYWTAIGHDMPIEIRAERLRELGHHAPQVKVRRLHV